VRRRILFAIVGTVALALMVAGAGTFLLLGRQADRSTESGLRAEVEGLAGLVDVSRATQVTNGRRRLLAGLRSVGISVVAVNPAGNLVGEPPDGVPPGDLSTSALVAGETLSGRSDGIIWAAASAPTDRGGAVVVVLTRPSERPRPPLGWFLASGTAALAVAAAVAVGLSDNLTRPLRRAQDTTVRIADGDLGARLPEPPPGDDEVAVLTRSINVMANALETSRGLERQFLLSVSHDLRTPLTSIRGYAEAISDGTAPVPADAARVIGTEAQRLARLVGDLLDLARLDADAFRFEMQVVPVGEVAYETGEGFRPAADAAGIELHVAEPSAGTLARVDPDRLAQAVANLVENGLKHATTGLWVEAQGDVAGGATVTVVDDGPGIDPADLSQVFLRLYVADRGPVRGPGGSGLGLAIVADLVAAMGGTATAASPALPDGTGARFTLSFPPPPASPLPTSSPPPLDRPPAAGST